MAGADGSSTLIRSSHGSARGRPLAPAADAIPLALAGDLRVALDRALAIAALSRLEAERSRLMDERVAAARAQLLGALT